MLQHQQFEESERNAVAQARRRLSPTSSVDASVDTSPLSEAETYTEEVEKQEIATDQTALIVALAKANQRRAQSMRWMWRFAVMILAAGSALIAMFFDPRGIEYVHRYEFVCVLMIGLGYLGIIAMLPRMVEAHHKAVRGLMSTEDLRAVGVLIEALFTSETANSVAGSILIRLLPHMRPEHAVLLTPYQLDRLHRALEEATNRRRMVRYNPALALAIMHALVQIGEARSSTLLAKLAKSAATNEEDRRLASTAAICHTHLQARLSGTELITESLDSDIEHLGYSKTTLTSEQVEEISSRLRHIAWLRQRNIKITLATSILITIAAFTMTATTIAHPLSLPTSIAVPAGVLIYIAIFAIVCLMLFFAVRDLYTQRNLTQSLMNTTDLRLISPILDIAVTGEVGGEAAIMLLTPLLPQLQASDSDLLDARSRENLNRAILAHWHNTDFVLAALMALQQIGDETAIPVVQKLAEIKSVEREEKRPEKTEQRTKFSRKRSKARQQVREAALECLPFLQHRAAEKAASQTLLRASDNATPSSALLRPVEERVGVAQEELLRPG